MTRTTMGGRWFITVIAALVIASSACRSPQTETKAEETETVARTEFTERIENFFEYEELKPGKASPFLIHLTDLSDGAPVEKADVTLTIRPSGGGTETQTKAKIGRVTGIYVADVSVPAPGAYTIEFRVVAASLDERMTLDGFTAK
jgi:hypothetical protein